MTDRYVLFGNPVEHSPSPRVHAAFAAQTGQDMTYDRLLVPLDEFAAAARAFFAGGGCAGGNVTLPFKADAYRFADRLSERTRHAGAVNALAVETDGGVLGDNTDGVDLVRDLTANLGWAIAGRRVLVLGAGGVTRGALGPLLDQRPALLHIANRTADKAVALAWEFAELGRVTGSGYPELAKEAPFELLINATSASLFGEVPPVPPSALGTPCAAYDMMYGAAPTPFLRWAAEQGVAALADGLGMLVEQAAESFALWRGVRPQTAPVIGLIRTELAER